jgi:dihydrofolate reductase
MQITLDGFSAGPNGDLDWMALEWDEPIRKFYHDLTDSVDTILMGRGMTKEFFEHWEAAAAKTGDEWNSFAQKMVNIPKIVFSRTLKESKWNNATVSNGPLNKVVNELKHQEGKDLMVYGGVNFVSELIKEDLIDEYYLFYNPVAIGSGMSIFEGLRKKFTLKDSIKFNKVVLMKYQTNPN